MLSKKIYFIAAVGTDIGKTFLVEKLCRAFPNSSVIKPIASGFRDDDLNSDSAKILAAMNKKVSQESLDEVSPWRFEEAISPHFAAQNSGREIDFAAVKNFCVKKISEAERFDQFLFIEAAGGVMTPLNNDKTFLDLVAELRIPVLLVTANYLGAISHTLSAVEALKSRGLLIEKIIVNESLPNLQNQVISPISTIQNFSKITTLLLENFLQKLS